MNAQSSAPATLLLEPRTRQEYTNSMSWFIQAEVSLRVSHAGCNKGKANMKRDHKETAVTEGTARFSV